jgi:hypothetical protein
MVELPMFSQFPYISGSGKLRKLKYACDYTKYSIVLKRLPAALNRDILEDFGLLKLIFHIFANQ